MIALSVNLNKIALIRNSREGNYPDIVEHANICIKNGAHGITVHPRPDQRHIRPDDVKQLHQFCLKHPQIELNIEGNPFAQSKNNYPGFMELVRQYPPHQCTLVPDDENQLTSNHGFNLINGNDRLKAAIAELKSLHIRVSLFMDPDIQQIKLAASLGADRIELYTGPFAACFSKNGLSKESRALFAQYCAAAEAARKLGMGINAGHDLNLKNLFMFRELPHLAEVSIGHALTVDAISMGLAKTVSAYLDVLKK